MNPLPHYGPELTQIATEQIQTLHQMTREILQKSENPDISDFIQLVLRRETLLHSLDQLPLQQIPPEATASLNTLLCECQQMDADIDRNMRRVSQDLQRQWNQTRSGKNLLNKYKLNDTANNETRSREA